MANEWHHRRKTIVGSFIQCFHNHEYRMSMAHQTVSVSFSVSFFPLTSISKSRVTCERGTNAIYEQRRPGSDCACAQSDLGLLCSSIHSNVSSYSVSGQWMSWSDCENAQDDMGFRCPYEYEGPFCTFRTNYIMYVSVKIIFCFRGYFPSYISRVTK